MCSKFVVIFCTSCISIVACVFFNDLKCHVRTRIETGWVCGLRRQAENDMQYISFRGIPYAEQPVGKLRFKELQPLKPWRHHLVASDESPICPQHDDQFEHIVRPDRGMSEACISVNVHVPQTYFTPVTVFEETDFNDEEALNETKRVIPVVVVIHGGAYNVGSGDSDLYGPEYLVTKAVIVVTFNYRLNVFGFLSLNNSKIPGNNGLRDQITLLRWVKRNIKSFGGDPTDITLLGQGSGASCAHLLTLSRAARGLFRRAVLMSGTAIPTYFSTSQTYAKFAATRFLELLGINSTDPDEIYEKLIQAPIEDILKANTEFQFEATMSSFSPVEESKHPGVIRILDDDPINLLKRGRGMNFPLIVGFTSEECQFFRNRFAYLKIMKRIKKDPRLLLPYGIRYSTPPNVTDELVNRVIERYFPGNITFPKYLNVCKDALYHYPAFKVAEWRAKMKGSAPVFLYQFSYESEYSVVKEAMSLRYNSSTHVEDLTYVLRENAVLGREKDFSHLNRDDRMKDWMTQFIINFIRCFNPSCSKAWPKVDKKAITYENIVDPYVHKNMKPTKQQIEMIKFFDNVYEIAISGVKRKPPKSKNPALWWQFW